MELVKRPFTYNTPGYVLTIGGHSVRLMLADLKDLAALVDKAISEAPQSEPKPPRQNITASLRRLQVAEKITWQGLDEFKKASIRQLIQKVSRSTGKAYTTKTDPDTGLFYVIRTK